MRLYPPVPKEEMAAYLAAHAELIWGDKSPISEEQLDTVAEALAMIGAIDVPADVEPMFP